MDLILVYNEAEQAARGKLNEQRRMHNLQHKLQIDAGAMQSLDTLDLEETRFANVTDWHVSGVHTNDEGQQPFNLCEGSVSAIAGRAMERLIESLIPVLVQNIVNAIGQAAAAQQQQLQANALGQRVLRNMRPRS